MSQRRPVIRDPLTGQMRGQRRVFLTAKQAAVIRKAWAEGLCRDAIAKLAGVTVDTLSARLRDQLADLPKRGRGVGGGKQAAPLRDPTPEEIWGHLTQEIQSRWTDEERENAWVGGRDFKRPETDP